jgi:hypothetical protein
MAAKVLIPLKIFGHEGEGVQIQIQTSSLDGSLVSLIAGRDLRAIDVPLV